MKSLALFDIHAEHIYRAIFDERAKLYQTLEKITLDEVSEADDNSSFVQGEEWFERYDLEFFDLFHRTIQSLTFFKNEIIEISQYQLSTVFMWM